MDIPHPNDAVLEKLVIWASGRHTVRAILLTGSRANPNAVVDVFSDYDVILVVTDIQLFVQDKGWLSDFGNVLVAYWDLVHLAPEFDIEQVGNVVQYADGSHIDFTLWPVRLMRQIVRSEALPDELDVGYRVLVDKDQLTAGLNPPTHTSHIPNPPTEEAFLKNIDDFFSDTPYVAKCLYRDELLPAKWCLDFDMKHNFLRQMLEWHVGIRYGWAEPVGVLGRGLKRKLSSDIWTRLEKTYVGFEVGDNWDALFGTMQLFREIGLEVAEELGYTYPLEMDLQITHLIQKMRGISVL